MTVWQIIGWAVTGVLAALWLWMMVAWPPPPRR